MIKLVAFDWNGTILSDTNAAVKANSAVMLHYGPRPTNLKEMQNTFSVPLKTYWTNMKISSKVYDKDYVKIRKIFFDAYEPLEKKCRSRANTKDILKWLDSRTIKSVIFSNHPAPHIQRQLHRLKISSYFDSILGYLSYEDHSMMHKRGKDIALKAYVKKIKAKTNEVILIGDTDEEIEIGKKFGYHTVALTGGYQSTARLKATKPDFLIHNLKDLKKIIQKINTQ